MLIIYKKYLNTHNPEVSGSNPLPATEMKPELRVLWFFHNQVYNSLFFMFYQVNSFVHSSYLSYN